MSAYQLPVAAEPAFLFQEAPDQTALERSKSQLASLIQQKDDFQQMKQELSNAFIAGDVGSFSRLKRQVEGLQSQIQNRVRKEEDDKEQSDSLAWKEERIEKSNSDAESYLQDLRLVHDQGNQKLEMLERLRDSKALEEEKLKMKILALNDATKELQMMEQLVSMLRSGKYPKVVDNDDEDVDQQSTTMIQQTSNLSSSDNKEIQELSDVTIKALREIQEKEDKIESLRERLQDLESIRTDLVKKRDSFLDSKDAEFNLDTVLEESEFEVSELQRKHNLLNMLSGKEFEEELDVKGMDEFPIVIKNDESSSQGAANEVVGDLISRLLEESVCRPGRKVEQIVETVTEEDGEECGSSTIERTTATQQSVSEERDEVEETQEEATLSMRATLERADESINKLVLNLYEMQQYEPKSEEELDSITTIRLSLLKQLSEMRDIRNQIKVYLQVVEAGVDFTEHQLDGLKLEDEDVERDYTSSMAEAVETLDGWVENAVVTQVELEEDKVDEDTFEQDTQTDQSFDTRMKGLFNQVKDKVYKDAAFMISQHECDPFFLLQMFRSTAKLDSNYSRQKLLIALDEILCEEEETFDDGACEHGVNEVKERIVFATPQNALKTTSLFEALREVRSEISVKLSKISEQPLHPRFIKSDMTDLKDFILKLLFTASEAKSAFYKVASGEIDECLDLFVNRSVKVIGRLGEEIDEIATGILYELSRIRVDLEGSGSDDEEDNVRERIRVGSRA